MKIFHKLIISLLLVLPSLSFSDKEKTFIEGNFEMVGPEMEPVYNMNHSSYVFIKGPSRT